MLSAEGCERDLRYLSAGVLDGVEPPHQRMSRSDLVVAIGAYQHEVLQIRPDQQILEQIQRGCVEPLQIVEEQRKRMFRTREHADQPTEYQLEAALRIQWRKFRDERLLSDNKLQLRDEVDHKPSVRAQRLQKFGAPAREL